MHRCHTFPLVLAGLFLYFLLPFVAQLRASVGQTDRQTDRQTSNSSNAAYYDAE